MTHFQIVTTDAAGDLQSQLFATSDPLAAFEVRGFKPTGRVGGTPLRAELHGHPKFFGLHGPMWGGLASDGEPIIRYESVPAYDQLSR